MSQQTNKISLWRPTEKDLGKSNNKDFMKWLADTRGLVFTEYSDLWEWSVAYLSDFLGSLWDYFNIKASRRLVKVLLDSKMPGAVWFQGAQPSYCENLFSEIDLIKTAII